MPNWPEYSTRSLSAVPGNGLSGPKEEEFACVRCLAACWPQPAGDGSAFPQQTWQLNLITTKLLLLSYHGLSPPPRPLINDFTEELCFARDPGFSRLSLILPGPLQEVSLL